MAKHNITDGSLALQGDRCRVITIPATEPSESITLRVAAYARVSSNSEDQENSFAAQYRYYTSLISKTEEWELVDICADEGITGISADKRGDFQRLMADCRRGLIDRVLVKSISRFARNTLECLEAIRELKSIGVSVFFEEQNMDTGVMSSEMLAAIHASFAQTESESISQNMKWGCQKRMQLGTFVPSTQPFGYHLVDGAIQINLLCAKYVCEIFSLYLIGWNTGEIALHLNSLQADHPELQGYPWTYKRVARILRNEKYIGDSLWQKSFHTDTLPRKELKNQGQYPQYYAENTHPS
jgi:DNA invertase Pin-like site-specific DNA recombinase